MKFVNSRYMIYVFVAIAGILIGYSNSDTIKGLGVAFGFISVIEAGTQLGMYLDKNSPSRRRQSENRGRNYI